MLSKSKLSFDDAMAMDADRHKIFKIVGLPISIGVYVMHLEGHSVLR